MLDSLIHHAAEALTVVMGLITLVHEAMPFLKKADLKPIWFRVSVWTSEYSWQIRTPRAALVVHVASLLPRAVGRDLVGPVE